MIALGVGVAAVYFAQGYFFRPKQAEQVSPPATSRPSVAESKPNDSASGAAAINPNIVTKDALNQLLQLATENDWNGVDAMVRSLKGVSLDGGNRKEARALNKSALELMAKNEFAAAVVELEKAALADHKDIEIRNNLGYAKLRVGNIDAAVFDLLEALLIDPTRAAAWLNASEAFAEKEKVAAADASLKLAFHFSRDQSKALAFLKGDQSQIPSEKFRATIQRTESVLATIPQYTR